MEEDAEAIEARNRARERLELIRAQRRRSNKGKPTTRALLNQVPDHIANDPELARAMKQLPSNYNFQVAKTIWRLRKSKAKRVALQMPEGLLMFACVLCDIFEQVGGVEETVILADVTYGACCVDDYAARALECDFMVHYGHSCLVPIDVTSRVNDGESPLQLMYVFVDIRIDVDHFVESVKLSFPAAKNERPKLLLMGTIQFAESLHAAKQGLENEFDHVEIPQAKPLSKGEVLGCTSPELEEYGPNCAIIFLADGRFHLESAMIANPHIPAYRYNPYDKVLTMEMYDTPKMKQVRLGEIERARNAKRWGIVMGTLGRQGNPMIVQRLEEILGKHGKQYFVLLLSETFPSKLGLLEKEVDAWVQVACPRLSIDWGTAFSKPLLTPYEAFVTLGEAEWRQIYPQDYYAKGSGPWTNYYKPNETHNPKQS